MNSTLLFYDRAAGRGEFYDVVNGQLVLLGAHDNFHPSWDMIVPVARRLLLFYDRAAGIGDFISMTSGAICRCYERTTAFAQAWT
jgi:hypothetical protein